MHIVYLDESGDTSIGILTALVIPVNAWQENFGILKKYRKELKNTDGIKLHKEFHAWKFVSGRGSLGDQVVTKFRRSIIFKETCLILKQMTGARLFNAIFHGGQEEQAFEWLMNRVQRTMQAWDSHCIIVSDEGKEAAYTRIMRKMHVYNPIPSKVHFGSSRNITIDRIIEDPFFKKSERSYFIQLVDFCAYALLRKEIPIPSKTKYGIHLVFPELLPVIVREANPKDPYGIVRLPHKKAGPTPATKDGISPAMS
ncbi:DUF3800 domain-containing protein [Candidatus Gracilibacteria bacterium]|nr:DUF3800 domain-containing protein [Candidatus Gracilibacteria bacterium]